MASDGCKTGADMFACRYVSYSCVDDGKAHNRKKHSGSAFDEAE